MRSSQRSTLKSAQESDSFLTEQGENRLFGKPQVSAL